MTTKREDWLSPLNRILIQGAVKAKAPQVSLRDGRTLTLKYGYFKPATTDGYDVVEMRIVGSLVPRGKFRLSTVKSTEWLGENDGRSN